MSDFKMVENRKYNDEEIRYVVSRVHAGWDPEIIAKAFKRDHGEYWADREFTKKQVAYIRSTYKPPPGVVKPYNGPIPEFSRSPTPEESPQPPSTASRKRKQAVGYPQNRPSSNQYRMYEQASSPIAGPSRKRQKTRALRDTPDLQGGSGEDQDQGLISPGELLPSVDDVGEEGVTAGLSDFNDNPDDGFDWENYGAGAFEEDPALRNLSLEPCSPGMMLPAAGLDQGPDLPHYLNLFRDIPVQSVETHRSVAPGSSTNATNSAFQTPQQQHHPQLGLPNPQELFPPGYSRNGATARDDPYGVWYFDPHDSCQIRLGHRHDMDGGVWFTSEGSVAMSLLEMKRTEGIGFMLGVATAAQRILNMDGVRYFDGPDGRRGINPQNVMYQAASIVREHVPEDLLDEDSFAVPDEMDIRNISEMNRSLPTGTFYDPFHRRAVRYDMPGVSGSQGGGQEDPTPGPSSQRDAQGQGVAGSSRQSRQVSIAPRVRRSPRQRTGTPRNVRPSHQGTGSPPSGRNPFQGTGTRPTVGSRGSAHQNLNTPRSLRSSRQGTGAPGASSF